MNVAPYTPVAEGVEAHIVYDARRRRIGKIFKPREESDREAHARREFERLDSLHGAFGSVEGVDVPRPIAFESDPLTIWMERAPGLPLSVLLSEHEDPPIDPEEIGRPLARGLRTCLEITGEPYYDFCPQNVICDPSGPSFSLVDFGVPRNLPEELRHGDPLPLSLGTFLGWSLYDLSRPSRITHLTARHPYLLTLRAMIGLIDEEPGGGSVSSEKLTRSAYLTFRRLGEAGGRLRGYWYRLLANRWFTADRALTFAL